MWASRALRCCLTAAASYALERPAFADGRACGELVVVAEDPVARRWPALPGDVRRAFAERHGVERCATVKLSLGHAGIGVQVLLADGRSAERAVRRSEDVVPVLDAMLVVPDELENPAPAALLPPSTPEEALSPKTAATDSRSPAAGTRGPARSAPAAAVAAERDALAKSSMPDSGLGIELSVATAVRAGDGQYSIGLAVTTLLDLERWLAGFVGRADSFSVTEGAPHATLELGALIGRRFGLDPVTLDLFLGPAVALQGEATVETGPAGERTETTSGIVPRLHVASHLNFAPRSALRAFLGVEGEFGPAGDSEPESLASLQPLPQWMLGLSLGATVGTR
jgi:hypothetical protein